MTKISSHFADAAAYAPTTALSCRMVKCPEGSILQDDIIADVRKEMACEKER